MPLLVVAPEGLSADGRGVVAASVRKPPPHHERGMDTGERRTAVTRLPCSRFSTVNSGDESAPELASTTSRHANEPSIPGSVSAVCLDCLSCPGAADRRHAHSRIGRHVLSYPQAGVRTGRGSDRDGDARATVGFGVTDENFGLAPCR
jgi:hypothetical protein